MSDQKVVIARLGAAYGIKGWLHITSFTDPSENIFNYEHWFIKKKNQWEPVQLETHKAHGNAFVIKIKGVDVREEAEHLKGAEISVDRNTLPETAEDEYYWSDLTGLKVITTTGEQLGEIDYLFETGSNDVIAIKDGKKQLFIPYTKDAVKSVDLEKQEMIVEWDPI